MYLKCGADHVKVKQTTPVKLPTPADPSTVQKYCSFDGDADRIVYYYLSDNQKVFHLLDGDKIATLVNELIRLSRRKKILIY